MSLHPPVVAAQENAKAKPANGQYGLTYEPGLMRPSDFLASKTKFLRSISFRCSGFLLYNSVPDICATHFSWWSMRFTMSGAASDSLLIEPMSEPKTKAELDAVAWRTIHTATVVRDRKPDGYAESRRPANYAELGQMIEDTDDFELAWSEFEHEFYRYRTASFFAERPPDLLKPEYQVMLAGAAEFLSQEFGLEPPAWTDEPRYTLAEVWDPWEDLSPDMRQFRDELRKRARRRFRTAMLRVESSRRNSVLPCRP